MPHKEVLAGPGKKVVMLGNVALARGALEYGISYASAYPGTPSTEITEALSYAMKKLGGPHVEWSANEKVALESALGAALAGVPALASMKHVGVNVAADPLFSSAYMGVNGALVIVSADDPNMWSSQNEQDNRYYGLHAYIPVVEPAGAQEAKNAIIEAFRISEKFKHPVILRTTTRTSHTRVPVYTGPIDPEKLKRKGFFEKNPKRYTLVPAHARRLREQLVDKWWKIRDYFTVSDLNSVSGPEDADTLIIGVGIGYRYALELIKRHGLYGKTRIVKLQTPVPLPEKLLLSESEARDKILVVEEGEPVVETLLKAVLQESGLNVRVHGKSNGLIPLTGELTLAKLENAIVKLFNVKPVIAYEERPRPDINLPPRPPSLCPGCPYRSVFYALRKAAGRARVKPIYSGDIGCYSLGVNPPFEMQDTIVEMGGSVGLANGLAKVQDNLVVAIIGDSTFFHAGLPGIANALYNGTPFLLVVLDNRTTAMTGHQPHPGVGVKADGTPGLEISIPRVLRGLGIEYVKVVDSFNVKEAEEEFLSAINYVRNQRKPAAIVARGACILVALANARRNGVKHPVYTVDLDKCTGCGLCYRAFNCPAIYPGMDGKARINPLLCTGCGECAQICPFGAFKIVGPYDAEWFSLMRKAKPIA